jgi:hypothetical protein
LRAQIPTEVGHAFEIREPVTMYPLHDLRSAKRFLT